MMKDVERVGEIVWLMNQMTKGIVEFEEDPSFYYQHSNGRE